MTGSEGKGIAAIPGSPDRTTDLHKRLTKTEKEILSLKTRIACERASWERKFAELQRKQEEIHNQVCLYILMCVSLTLLMTAVLLCPS